MNRRRSFAQRNGRLPRFMQPGVRSAVTHECSTCGVPDGSGPMAVHLIAARSPRLMDVLLDRQRALSLRVTTAASRRRAGRGSEASIPALAARVSGGLQRRRMDSRYASPGSTRSSATRRGTWCAATAAIRHARESRRDAAKCLTNFVREAGHLSRRHAVARQSLPALRRARAAARTAWRPDRLRPASRERSPTADARRFAVTCSTMRQSIAVVGFDNRHGIFPIHRSVRFVLMSAHHGSAHRVGAMPLRTERHRRISISSVHEATRRSGSREAFISRLSGDDDLAIPEIRDSADLRILEQISARFPMLQSPSGWNVAFGRELNATDDRGLFVPFDRDGRGRPVLEGKQIEPFRVSVEGCRYQLREHARVRIAAAACASRTVTSRAPPIV